MSQRVKISIISAAVTLSMAAGNLTVSEAADSIVTSSYLITAADARMRSEAAAVRPLTNLPNPELGFDHLWGGEGNKLTLSVSQSFDWPGVYGKRAKAAELQTSVATARRNLIVQQARWDVEELLIEALYQLDRRALLDSIGNNYAQLAAAYRRSYELGEGTILDVKKIEIQQLSVDALIGECDQAYRETLATLTQYNRSLDYTAMIQNLSPQLSAIPDRNTLSPRDQPEFMLATLTSMAAEQQISLARSENLPGFSVGYVYNREIGQSFNGLSASVTLPLWGNRNKVGAAEAELEATEADKEDVAARLVGKINTEWEAALQSRRRLDGYDRVLDGNDTPRLLDMALKGGQISVLEYLQESEYFMQAELDRLAVRRDLTISTCRLLRYVHHSHVN